MKLKSRIIVIVSLLSFSYPYILKAGILNFPFLIRQDKAYDLTSGIKTINCHDSITAGQTKRSAEMVMKMVLLHLPDHDPSNFNSFSSISNTRFRVSAKLPDNQLITGNSTTENTFRLNNNNFLYASETLTYHKYLKPGFKKSETLSSRTLGTDDGSYIELYNSLNDFSLLNPGTELLNKTYLSPFSGEAPRSYLFNSTDSVTTSGDTLCKVTFSPATGIPFFGYTGTAVIDPQFFAIHQIDAVSARTTPGEPFLVISQRFEQLKGLWLPSGKTIRCFLKGKNGSDMADDIFVELTASNYQQEVNPPLSPAEFKDPLLKTDDTIMAEEINKQTKIIRLMAEGKVSTGCFNLDYNKIFGYNLFEGVKLGLGGETNNRFSRHFTIGGYINYGLRDKLLHHGEWIDFYPMGSSGLRVHLSYKDMNLEFGGPEFLGTTSLLNPESYRNLLIKNMFSTKRYATGLEFSRFSELNLYLFSDISENSARQDNGFLSDHPFNPISLFRTGFQLRYSPGIKIKTKDGRQDEIAASKVNCFLSLIQGLTILNGEYRYTKVEFKGKFQIPFSRIGTTTIMLRGGILTPYAPVIELFNGYGSFAGTFSLASPYSFATMQLNEFAASKYTAIHLRHNFSTWLFPGKISTRPAFVVAQNIGIGKLSEKNITQFNQTDYRNGFYESGFEINNILRMNYLSWGIGIYYRYGPYQYSSIGDNFAYKFGFFFNL
jgi:hypothetical protein